jgi:hypothetical protein
VEMPQAEGLGAVAVTSIIFVDWRKNDFSVREGLAQSTQAGTPAPHRLEACATVFDA